MKREHGGKEREKEKGWGWGGLKMERIETANQIKVLRCLQHMKQALDGRDCGVLPSHSQKYYWTVVSE